MKTIKIFSILLAGLFLASCDADETVTDDELLTEDFLLTSEAIIDGFMLADYQCEDRVDGAEPSLPLAWQNVPEGTGSLAITMVNSDNGNSYLLLWDIDPNVTSLAYGAADDGPHFMGQNKDGNAISYTSPCSPGGGGSGTLVITLYALSETPASLPQENSLAVDYETLMNAIASVSIMGEASLEFVPE